MVNPIQDFAGGLTKLYADIGRYNTEHHQLKTAVQSLIAEIHGGPPSQESPIPPKSIEQPSHQAQAIFDRSVSLLARMGLEMRAAGELSDDLKSTHKEATLSLAVVDCQNLTRALQSLSPQSVEPAEHRASLEQLAKDITRQFLATKSLVNPEAARDELAKELPPVLAQFERLGIPVGNLRLRIEQHQEGTLQAHLFADALQLTVPPVHQTFGPAQWHTDCAPQDYENRWKIALRGARVLSSLENSKELHQAVERNLLSSAAVAREQIEHNLFQAQTPGGKLAPGLTAAYMVTNGPGFLDVLERATSVLRGELDFEIGFPER